MGKGDKRTKLGKRFMGTYGVSRKRKKKKRAMVVVATKKKTTSKKAAAKTTSKSTTSKATKADDFKKIEGIGPKIAKTLQEAGVKTFKELAKMTPEKISEVISEVRGNHVTNTWPKQAELAAEGKWEELKAWQDKLSGGKESK